MVMLDRSQRQRLNKMIEKDRKRIEIFSTEKSSTNIYSLVAAVVVVVVVFSDSDHLLL